MISWRTAMERALYGEGGFYRRGERPAAHFRTSVHASARFAAALARLLAEVDDALGRPARLDLVDIGAGDGTLLASIMQRYDGGGRLAVTAVERAPRPPGLRDAIAWVPEQPGEITGLVIANEWLDNVPVDIVELTLSGPRMLLVDPHTGAERLGSGPSAEDLAWLRRWWVLREPGERAEVGRPRCVAWAETIGRLSQGVALAIDYAHSRADRPACGTLTGYRDGHAVSPVPDGSCDITAHVALDACVEAGRDAGATASLLTTQREALRSLGLTGSRPPLDLAHTDPRAYVGALAAAGEEAELIDPAGLGGFGWLIQSAGVDLPPTLRNPLASG